MARAGGAPDDRAGPARGADPPGPESRRCLLLLGRGDSQLLDDLVVAPLGRVVADDLEHEVERLLPVALAVELDVTGDAVVLDLAHRRRDVFATRRLAPLGRRLDRLQG